MTGLRLVCADCGGAILHECGANSRRNLTQTGAIAGANPEIAEEILDLDLQPSSQGKSYNQGYDLQFLSFWKIYPAKRDKRKAQIAWRKAVLRLTQTGANRTDAISVIEAGAIRYRDEVAKNEDMLIKYAEGWLNGDRWEDEPMPDRVSPNGRREEPPSPYAAEAEYRAFMEDYRAKQS